MFAADRSIIKICGLSTAPTLDAALRAGADAVGLVFFPKSPRHVGYAEARALGDQARGRARIAALSVDANDETLEKIVAALDPDVLQLHGRESPERVADIRHRFGRPVMKAIGVAAAGDFAAAQPYADVADWLLIDAKPPEGAGLPGGNGRAFDWRLAQSFRPSRPWMLSGGLDPSNVAAAIARSGSRSVDVSSGVEMRPGVKDPDRIAAFVAAARASFAAGRRGGAQKEDWHG
jgi:phosphoribosylanthranilate isomerase